MQQKCKKCGGNCNPSKGLVNTDFGVSDWEDGSLIGGTRVASNNAILKDCLKCENCGHSFIPNKK